MEKEKLILFWKEYKKSKAGMFGLSLLLLLIGGVVFVFLSTGPEKFKEWNDYKSWQDHPKLAAPSWTGIISGKKISKHQVLNKPEVKKEKEGSLTKVSHIFEVNIPYDEPPKGFSYQYSVRYKNSSPFLILKVLTPAETEIQLGKPAIPFTDKENLHEGTISSVGKSVIFSEKGIYKFVSTFYFSNPEDRVEFSQLVVEGKTFGLLGTDVYGRDLWLGVLWGLPTAFLIGISVSFLSLVIGLIYGVVSAYTKRSLRETMSLINYIIICLPVLPFLIIMVAALGQSLFNIIFYLVVFGWNGIVLIVREKALQEVSKTYIEDLELEGASGFRIIFKHLIPETMPYALVNMVLGVPAAILAEASLSFIGLGDPTLPTWGQILHDAQVAGAPALGMWWWVLPPGIAIMIISLAFGLIAEGLDTTFAPRLKKR